MNLCYERMCVMCHNAITDAVFAIRSADGTSARRLFCGCSCSPLLKHLLQEQQGRIMIIMCIFIAIAILMQ